MSKLLENFPTTSFVIHNTSWSVSKTAEHNSFETAETGSGKSSDEIMFQEKGENKINFEIHQHASGKISLGLGSILIWKLKNGEKK